MALRKAKNIEEIDDLFEMFQALAALGISCKGLQTLDDLKRRARDELSQTPNKPSWEAGQASSILSQAKDEDERKRKLLLKFFFQSEYCLKTLDDKLVQLLEQNIGSIDEKMKTHQAQLKQKEYFLLVAGETGSGKSSLVNLILGEELLPYSVLSTTSTICELKYGKQRRIVAHFKDKDPETGLLTMEFPLKDASSEQSYLEQISPYVHVKGDREKGSVYKKIELFWPHQLLKNGVVIIDSPGIGESAIMDEIVTQYLPQAFAFIYVINSANAGGVQKDRLEKLLEDVRKVTLEGQGGFTPQCAMFVCNKWDQIPEKEAREVQNYVTKKLKNCWPGLVPESQIMHMSTKNASVAQNHGRITEDFSTLMNCIKCMVLKAIDTRLEMHRKWLDCFLSRVIFQGKAFMSNASGDHVKAEQKLLSILHRLNKVKSQHGQVMEELQRNMKTQVEVAVKTLSEYLTSDNFRARFTSWTLDEVPKAETSWEVTWNNIMKALRSRMKETLDQFEEDNQMFANARESLVQLFQQRFSFVEGELRNLQGAAADEELDIPESDLPDDDPLFTTREKVIIGVASPIWVPLSLVALVIGVPVVGVLAVKSKVEDKYRIKNYEKDKCAFMARTSADYLDDVTNEIKIRHFVEEQLEEAKLCLKQIEARIPGLIEADELLYNQLRDERRSSKEIQALYKPSVDEASSIRGNLAVFGLKEIHALDISSEELDWKEDMSSRLWSGTFVDVYQGKLKRHGLEETLTVELKVYNEVLTTLNANQIMAKVDLLRKLEHPHIVKFYGTSLLKEENTTRVILVMEKCKGSLKSQIFDHPEVVPSNSSNSAVYGDVCRWAKEITDALEFIHKQGIIHRNLTLETIVLTEENSVKITEIAGFKEGSALAGTLAYIAPEVFHSKVYDSKVDIYSFGVILWEIWYGQHAFAEVKVETLITFVDGGNRPEHMKDCKKPPQLWQELMEKCWNGNSEERPSAEECKQKTTELYVEFVKLVEHFSVE